MYIHKNGLKLSKITQIDLSCLKMLKDESWFGTHHIAIVNMEDQQKWFDNLDSNKTLILSVIFESKIIGYYKLFNIDWINRKYDMSYDVMEYYRGKGFSYKILEAGVDFTFELLNMNRIDTEVLENNLASQKSLKKIGFVEEGKKREAVIRCNKKIDSIVMGLLHSDWSLSERVVKSGEEPLNKSYKPKNDLK